jgi:hypothetical protein
MSKVSIVLDGGTVVTAANTPVTPTTIYIGNTNNGASGPFNGYIRVLASYSSLSDGDLDTISAVSAPLTITTLSSLNAVVNQTLEGLTNVATAQVTASAVVNQSLGALGQSFASTVVDAATTTQTLGALQQTLAATIPDTAAVAQTLATLSQTATAISGYVLNPIDKHPDIVLSGGNLTATYTTSNTSGNVNVRGTQPGSTGRYFEVTFGTIVTGQVAGAGIGLANLSQSLTGYPGDPNSVGWFGTDGYAEWPGSGFSNNFGTFTTSNVLGVLLKASSVEFYKTGTLVGTATALPSGSLYPVISLANNTDAGTANFGATALSYLPAGATSWDGTQTSGTRTAVVAQTLGGLVQTTPAAVTVAGVVAQTLGALSQTATATAIDTAAVAQTLGALTQTATATVKVAAAVTQTLGTLGQTTTVTVQDTASVSQTLGTLQQTLATAVADAAAVAQTLGVLGQTATAAATDTATTSQTLGVLNQTATAIHQAASAVVDQTLGALGQTATAAATDTAAVAQTLDALQQAVTAAATVAATTAQTLGALQQLASAQVTDTVTFQDNLGALQQTATGAVQVNAAVTQLLGSLGQTATAAVVGQALIDQVLPGLDQNFFSSQSAHATVAQILGDLVQAATDTVDVTAAVAQTLGGLTQLTGATVDVLINTIQTLGSLAQAASATAPSVEIDALVAQSLGVLQQAVSGEVPVATAVSQVLTSLGQLVSDTVLNRATVAQLLQGLQQAATVVAPPPTTIMPESVVFVMYEQRILVVPTESRTLMVPGMYTPAGILPPVIRLRSQHLLESLQQIATAHSPLLQVGDALALEDGTGVILLESGERLLLEEYVASVISIGGAQTLPSLQQTITARGPLGTTLNPGDKSVNINLTNSNLTAASNSGSGMVRATKPGGANRYFEFIFSSITSTFGSSGVGVASLSQNLASYMGDPNGAGYFQNGYAEWLGSGTGISWPGFTTGDVLGIRLRVAATGGTGVTWNAADKSANITLSGGNLIATAAGSGNVRANTAGSAGRYYEIVWNSHTIPGFGLATAAQSLSAYPGDPNAIGFFGNGYVEWPGSGTSNSTSISWIDGDVMGILLGSSNAQLIKNGTLVYTVNVLPSGPLYPILSMSSGESATANFGATAMGFLPVGATSWDGSRTNAGTTTTTWNTSDQSGLTFSNGDLTATGTGTGGGQVRATRSGTPNRYFEVHIDADARPGSVYVGLANTSQTLLSGYASDPNGICYFDNTYAEWPGSGFSGLGAAYGAGDTIGVELLASSAQLYKNGTLQVSALLPAGALFPIVGLYDATTSSVTANFGATAFANLPSGAVGWNT